MTELVLWTTRRFPFGFDAGLHPNLRIRLRGAPARLEELTVGLSLAVLAAREGGAWSIQENAGHLLDLEALWQCRLGEFLAGAARLTAADMSNASTHQARHNEHPLVDILAGFRAARWAWLDRLEALTDEGFDRTALHPRLDRPMRLVDHLLFVAEHDDHHLARIWALRRQLVPGHEPSHEPEAR